MQGSGVVARLVSIRAMEAAAWDLAMAASSLRFLHGRTLERHSNIEREGQRYDRRRRTKGRKGTWPVLVASVVDDGIQGRHRLGRFKGYWPGTEIEEGWVEGSDRSRGRGETSWRNQWVAALGGLDRLRLGLGVDLFK